MSEALRLAEWIESDMSCDGDFNVAVCLRRLHAENERLRADAERYRWMKQNVKRIPPVWEMIGWDAAIDAARAALKEST